MPDRCQRCGHFKHLHSWASCRVGICDCEYFIAEPEVTE